MVKQSRKKTSAKKPKQPQKIEQDLVLPLETPRAFRWRSRGEWVHVGIVLGLAFVLRLVFFYFNQKNNPVFFNPIMDALYHHEWAQEILNGTATADDVYFRGPLYPYLLAIFYKLSGSSIAFAVFAQHVIGTLTAGFVYLLAREYFSPRVSLVAGIFAALYWPLVYFEGDLLIVTIFLFLNTLGLLLLARALRLNSYMLLAVSGLVFGLAAIARPSVLIFLVALPAVVYWSRRKDRDRPHAWIARNAVLVGAILAVILPVMIRNYVVGRSIVPVAASGGVNFYIGNNPESDGSTAIVPNTRADWWGGYQDAIDIAERGEGRKLNLSEVSNYFFNRGVQWITSHPGDAASHFFKKFRLFWAGPERANNKFIYFFWNLAGMKYVILPGFWLLAPLALVGGILQWRRRRRLSPLYLFVALYMAGVIVFFVNARFRLPVIPVMILFAAHAAVYFVTLFRNKDFRLLRVVVLLAVAFILINLDYLAFARIRAYSNAFSHTTMGNAYMKMGQHDTALDHYTRAWNLNEESPTGPFQLISRDVTYNIGLLYWEKGLCSRAIEALRRVGGADKYAQNALDWLGDCYLKQSKYENAAAVFREFVRIAPDDVRAITGMARLHAATGNLEEAERILASVVDPTATVHVPAFIALAEVQYRLGKTRAAIESYTTISRYLGYEKEAFLALAELHQEAGNIDAAIDALEKASPYFLPGDPTIRNRISQLRLSQ